WRGHCSRWPVEKGRPWYLNGIRLAFDIPPKHAERVPPPRQSFACHVISMRAGAGIERPFGPKRERGRTLQLVPPRPKVLGESRPRILSVCQVVGKYIRRGNRLQ